MSDDECHSPAKQQKLTDDPNKDQETIAGPSNRQSPLRQPTIPSIFKLDIDCFDEIFEYLSMKDLYSFGQTCKSMQKVAGEYFKRNYFGAVKYTTEDGIYTGYYDSENASKKSIQTSNFNQYITELSQHKEKLETLCYIERHIDEFDSVNNLNFISTHVNMQKVKYFRKILAKIEHVRLHKCTAHGNIFQILLQYCENMTQLTIHDDFGDIIGITNPWLLHCYPKLKQLHLCSRYVNEFYELAKFFEQNPQVEEFSTNFLSLLGNQNQLMYCNAKLNRLSVEDIYSHTVGNLQEVFTLLKTLYGRGFYKRLHLHFENFNSKICNEMAWLPGLEKLRFDRFTDINNLSCLTNLKELHLPNGLAENEILILAIHLVNLEKVTISTETPKDLLPFIHRSAKLSKLYAYIGGGILNLQKWNKERERLLDARKMTIYVRDHIFLKTKWATHYGDINLKLVEMRRINSAVPAKVWNANDVQLPIDRWNFHYPIHRQHRHRPHRLFHQFLLAHNLLFHAP